MKKLLFLFLLGGMLLPAAAQKKSAPVKFDEFDDGAESYYSADETSLKERIDRFVAQIKKERGIRVYIIRYEARKLIGREQHKISYWAMRTEREITSRTKLEYDDVVVIEGGHREKNTLEYWIAPKNSGPPAPTPTFDKSEAIVCPEIEVRQDGMAFDKNYPLRFVASVYPKTEVTYAWKTSAGSLAGEQGAETMEVDLSNAPTGRVTVFVEVAGLPAPCGKAALATVDVGLKPYAFDSAVRYNFSDLRARLDGFLVALQNNPVMTGYVIVYAGRKSGVREMEMALRGVRLHLAFRNFDTSRIVFVRGGFREYNTVDTWLVPPGAEAPVPSPSVDSKFVAAPRAKTRKKR
jgi:hypothetical protein